MTPDWSEAKCAGYSYRPGVNPDLFFPDNANQLGKRAKEMCNNCPIIVDCLEWALNHERWGYWAGTHPEQRDDIRQRRNITLQQPPGALPKAPCGTEAGWRAHRRRGETCPTCTQASTRKQADRDRRRKQRETA